MTLSPIVRVEINGTILSCSLLGINRGEIHLKTEQSFQPGFQVVVAFERVSLTGEVVYSKTEEQGFRTCIVLRTGDHAGRTEPRFPIDEPATLIVLPDAAPIWSSSCRLVDFSRSGLGLMTSAEVNPGTMACVETTSLLVVGEVCYSGQHEPGLFQVGIELTDVLLDEGLSSRNAGLIARIRVKLAEFILGRPISRFRAGGRIDPDEL